MSVVSVLEAARARLAEKGWRQGDYGTADGPCCLFGAINLSEGLPANCDDKLSAEEERICQLLGVVTGVGATSGNLVVWNDAPGRTQEEVLAAFDKAIALARSAP